MSAISTAELREIIKVATEILHNRDSVEVASPVGVNVMGLLEKEVKQMQWLRMPEAAYMLWMKIKLII